MPRGAARRSRAPPRPHRRTALRSRPRRARACPPAERGALCERGVRRANDGGVLPSRPPSESGHSALRDGDEGSHAFHLGHEGSPALRRYAEPAPVPTVLIGLRGGANLADPAVLAELI